MPEIIEEPNDFDVEGEDVDEIINYLIRTQMAKIDYGFPAIIGSFNDQNNTISCKIIGSVKISGTEKEIDFPALNGVPLLVPYGGNAAFFVKPSVGDYVWLTLSSRSIDEAKNGADDKSKTSSKRRFSIQDCVAIYGFSPFAKPVKNVNSDDFFIGFNDKNTQQIPFPNAFSGKDNRLRIGSQENDLVKVLYDLVACLQSAVDTGGFVFNPATQAILTALKAQIEFIKYP